VDPDEAREASEQETTRVRSLRFVFFDGAGLHGGGGITGLILFCPSFREKAILCRFSE